MLRKKTATYALLAVYEIAQQQQGVDEVVGVRAHDIAQKHKLPKAYAAKILSQLANSGILHSDRGPRGGFRMNRPPKEITLFDIFEGVDAIIGSRKRSNTVQGLPPRIQSIMTKANQQSAEVLKELFSKTTLAEILG